MKYLCALSRKSIYGSKLPVPGELSLLELRFGELTPTAFNNNVYSLFRYKKTKKCHPKILNSSPFFNKNPPVASEDCAFNYSLDQCFYFVEPWHSTST
jgi:hypothetical protein